MSNAPITPTIVNLTPHPITVPDCMVPTLVMDAVGGDGYYDIATPVTWRTSGIARALEVSTAAAPIAGVPTSTIIYSGTDGLPAPAPGVFYVVSTITAEAAWRSGRVHGDLLVPGSPVRDDAGRIIGCKSLVRWTPPAARPAPGATDYKALLVKYMAMVIESEGVDLIITAANSRKFTTDEIAALTAAAVEAAPE